MKRYPLFEIILIVVYAIVILYGVSSDGHNFPRNWFDRDDAYYYFKVAQNITQGQGSTFDGLNLTNGYHPLWMLVCIPIFALARYDLILPLRILFVLMELLRLATAIGLYRLLKRAVSEPIAMFFAGYWAFDYFVGLNIYQQGLETGMASLLIVLLIYVLSQKEEAWKAVPATRADVILLALLATLVMFSRLDLVFLAGLIGLRVVFRKSFLRDMLGLDLLFIFTSVLSGFVLRLDIPQYYNYSDAAFTMIALSAMIRIPILYLARLYENLNELRPFGIIKRSFFAVVIGSALIWPLMLLCASFLHFDVFPRITLLYDLGFSFLFVGYSRLGAYWFANPGDWIIENKFLITPWETLKKNWKTWLADGAGYYGIVLGALLIYMLFNHFTFGTTSPVSGQVKRWWGSYESRVYGGAPNSKLDFYGVNPETGFNAWPPLVSQVYQVSGLVFHYIHWKTWWQFKYGWTFFGMLFLAALIFSFERIFSARGFSRLIVLPLIAAAGLQLFSYTAGGYAGVKEWYWITQYIVYVLFSALLIDVFTHHIVKIKGGQAFLSLVVIAFLLLRTNGLMSNIRSSLPHVHYPANTPYVDAVPFLESHTPAGSLIGMTGGGNVGYFIHDRTIVNMDGLINSEAYFKALQSKNADQYLAGIGLDYIFANPEILNSAPYHGQFNDFYDVSLDRFGGKVLIKLLQDLK